MKKLFILAVLMLGIVATASAQPRALGLRGGIATDISYQHGLGNNFLEFDLGWDTFSTGLDIAVAYDFSIVPLGPLGFYAGPAIDLFTSINNGGNWRLGLGVGAQIGLEYFFEQIPLQLSLDWRPMINVLVPNDYIRFSMYGAALGIRYVF